MEDNQKAKYKLLKKIGEGTYGKVYMVESERDNKIYVIKTIYIDKMNEQEIKESLLESKIMEKLEHPNIISFKETFMMKKPKRSLCIVMDFAEGGDLKDRIKKQKNRYFPEYQIIDWFTQICLAIKHIHDRKILHRDLKSQNIFLDKNDIIKLGDFGIAKALDFTLQKASTFIGTPYYLSPEIVQNQDYSFKSDVWSMGVLLYEMCALKMPYDANSMADLILKIIKGSFTPIPNHFSKELKMLVNSLLCVDQQKRPSVNEILRLPLIKSRIKNFLSEIEYNEEFSHTILHDYNPIKHRSESNPIIKKTKEEEKKDSKKIKEEEKKDVKKIKEDDKKDSSKKVNSIEIKHHSQSNVSNNIQAQYTKPIIHQNSVSPVKINNNLFNNQNNMNRDYKNKLSEFLKMNNKKVVTQNNQNSKMKGNEDNFKKPQSDIYNGHKLLVELNKISEDQEIETMPTENYENLKKTIKINLKNEMKDDYIEENSNFSQSEPKSDLEKNQSNNSIASNESSQFDEIRAELISKIGEPLFKRALQIVDETMPPESFFYDHEKISKSIIKLSNEYDINSILICIDKIQEIYTLVVRERELLINKK